MIQFLDKAMQAADFVLRELEIVVQGIDVGGRLGNILVRQCLRVPPNLATLRFTYRRGGGQCTGG